MDLLKDLHIIVEALRNSFSLLHERLFGFLLTHVVCDMEPGQFEDVMEFWQLLGVDAAMLEAVALVNPCWRDGQLHVSAALANDEDKVERISAVVLYLFRFRKFVDSRWCTVGASLRAVLASLAAGLPGLVELTRADPKASDYHLRGFIRMKCAHLLYMVLAAVVAYVPDGALYLIMDDDRLLARRDELLETLQDELRYIGNLSRYTWDRLTSFLPPTHTAKGLRSICLQAANVAHAYFFHKACK